MTAHRYGCIIMDPLWRYRNNGGNGAAEVQYPTMSVAERFRPLAEEDAAAASARAERAEQDLARLQATIAGVERDLTTALRQWAGNTDIGRYASGWPLISESTDHEDIEARMYTAIVVRQRSRERQGQKVPDSDNTPAPIATTDHTLSAPLAAAVARYRETRNRLGQIERELNAIHPEDPNRPYKITDVITAERANNIAIRDMQALLPPRARDDAELGDVLLCEQRRVLVEALTEYAAARVAVVAARAHADRISSSGERIKHAAMMPQGPLYLAVMALYKAETECDIQLAKLDAVLDAALARVSRVITVPKQEHADEH